MLLLAHVDRASGLPVRYERPALGDLVHVDIKKLARILGSGWRVHGRVFAQDLEASSRRKAKPLEHERQAHATTATSTTLLTTIPRWCTQRFLTTNAIRAQRDSEPAPTRSSRAWA